MKARIIIGTLLLVGIVGCTTYTDDMSEEDRIIARYEQNFSLGDDDPDSCSKITKHVFVDIFTLCIAETWYGHARHAYDRLMKDRRNYEELVKVLMWKDKMEIMKIMGSPDRSFSLASEDVWAYQKRSYTFNGSTFVVGNTFSNGLSVGSGGVRGNGTENVSELLIMFDKDGHCSNVSRKMR